MKNTTTALTVIFIFLFFSSLYGQFEKVDQVILFQSNIKNPIKVEVIEQNGRFVFYAINESFYPYQLNINFEYLINLTPQINSRDFTIVLGRNRLFDLTILDPTASHTYQYKTSYRIGTPSKKIDLNYPYLIPLSKTNSFEFVKHPENEHTIVSDFFKLKKGDTIYSMRKGVVVASPNMFIGADRISKNKSLEIMHQDGSIMIYENLDTNKILVKPGSVIYPGQALGTTNEESILKLYLYMILDDYNLKRLNINYYTDDGKTQKFSDNLINTKIVHPKEIIINEMTKREIKKNGF